jgi:hypothetical protein
VETAIPVKVVFNKQAAADIEKEESDEKEKVLAQETNNRDL